MDKFWSKEKCWCQTVSAFAHQQVLIKSDIAKMGAWDSFFREWENMLLEQYLKCKTLTRKPKVKILICWKSGNNPSIISKLTKLPSSSLLLHISVKFQKLLCCFSETWKWSILLDKFYKRVLIMKLHSSIFWKRESD